MKHRPSPWQGLPQPQLIRGVCVGAGGLGGASPARCPLEAPLPSPESVCALGRSFSHRDLVMCRQRSPRGSGRALPGSRQGIQLERWLNTTMCARRPLRPTHSPPTAGLWAPDSSQPSPSAGMASASFLGGSLHPKATVHSPVPSLSWGSSAGPRSSRAPCRRLLSH